MTSLSRRKYDEASTSGEQSPATSRPLYYITQGMHSDIVWWVLRMVRIELKVQWWWEKLHQAYSLNLQFYIYIIKLNCYCQWAVLLLSNTTWFHQRCVKIKAFHQGDVIQSLQVTLSLHSHQHPGVSCSRDLLDYEHQTISLFLVMFQDLGETVAGVSDRHNVFCGQLLWKTQSQCI